MNIIKFTIPLPPASKKNSQRIMLNRKTGKPFIMPSAQFKAYESSARRYIPRQQVLQPVTVSAFFYMQTRRRVDLVNLLEALDDILVLSGLLEDDNCLVIPSHDGSRVFYDKDFPRTEVQIAPYEGAAPW